MECMTLESLARDSGNLIVKAHEIGALNNKSVE